MDPVSNSGCPKSGKRTPTTIISIMVNATLCKKHINSILAKKFSTFYGSQGFITTPIRRSHHMSLFHTHKCSNCCPHTSYFLKTDFNVILPPMPRIPCGLLPSGFPTKTLYAPLLTSIHTTYPIHLNLTAFTTQIYGKHSRSQNSSIYNLLQSLLCCQLAQLSSSAP